MKSNVQPEVIVSGGSFGGRGGIETHVARWCGEFARQGWKVTLVISASPQSRPRLEALASCGVRCLNLGTGHAWVRALRAGFVGLGLRRKKILFYSHGHGRIAQWLGFVLQPAKWVHHHHVNYATGDISLWPTAEQRMVIRADQVVMCSRIHAERLAADTGVSNTVFVPYLKSEGELLPPPADGVATVVYMGLMRQSKGVPLLLSLAPWFRQNGCRLVLWGRDAEGILDRGVPEGVDWRGEYDPERDLDTILGEASCLALPFMEGEGLPIVISEALSRGVPIAAFGFSGIDWLRGLHPGLAIVDGGSSEQLTKEIHRLIRSGRDASFRASLRDAYLRCLGNGRCIEWWLNFCENGN